MKHYYTASKSFNPISAQKGVALITVLFLFALASIIVGSLVILQQTDIQRASAVLETEQAYLLSLSGEEWARQLLAEDYNTSPNVDHVHEKWAADGNILEVENGYIEISIRDAQGKFNLNNLASSSTTSPGSKIAFQRLINMALQDQQLSTTIAEEATDWLDADSTGIEDMDYLSEPVPYRPPNTIVTDTSELRWLKDMDQKTYQIIHQEIFPFLVALPKQTPVNINTASPLVIASLTGLSLSEAEAVVSAIQSNKNGYSSVASATNMQQIATAAQNFGVYSEYFEVRVRAKFSDHYAFLTSIIFRDHQNHGKMIIVSRDRSERFIFPFSKDYNSNSKSKDYEFDI
jgi:general secretion pathway protein K